MHKHIDYKQAVKTIFVQIASDSEKMCAENVKNNFNLCLKSKKKGIYIMKTVIVNR